MEMDWCTIDNDGLRNGCFRIRLNAKSPVYAAHFPGMPITPGACLVELVTRLLDLYNLHFTVYCLKNVKFLKPLSPIETPEVICEIENCRAVIRDRNNVFAKMTIECTA